MPSQEQLFDTYRNVLKNQLLNYKELKSLTETYDSLLKDDNLRKPYVKSVDNRVDALIKGITRNYGKSLNPNLINYMENARQNRFVPSLPTDSAILEAQRISGNVLPMDRIIKLFNNVVNKTITD